MTGEVPEDFLPSTREDLRVNAWAMKLKREAGQPTVVPAPVVAPNIGLEDLDLGDTGISDAAQQVSDACASLTIVEVYTRISKNRWKRPYQGELKDGIHVSCPRLDHPDDNPSAFLNTIKGLWACVNCGDGGDLYVMAARAWALDHRSQFWQIKCRLAKELRGVDYDALMMPTVLSQRETILARIRGDA